MSHKFNDGGIHKRRCLIGRDVEYGKLEGRLYLDRDTFQELFAVIPEVLK